MTDDKLYTSLSANTIMAKVTNHFQRTKLITSSTDKHYSLDSEDDFRSGCRNVSHQQQFFSELHSPGRSYYTNYLYIDFCCLYFLFIYLFILLVTEKPFLGSCNKICMYVSVLIEHISDVKFSSMPFPYIKYFIFHFCNFFGNYIKL